MFEGVMEGLSTTAMTTYRSLIYETPGFADYFFSATPIFEISQLNLGSRPAARKATNRIEDLRAIPWGVFLGAMSPIITRMVRPWKRNSSILAHR